MTHRFEICSNQKDDNADGKTDCADPECFASPVCGLEGAGGGFEGAGGGAAGGAGGSGGGTAGGTGGGTAGGVGGGTAGGMGGGTAGGAGGGTAGGAGGGTAGGAGGGTAGGGGAGGGAAGGSGGGTAGGAGGGTAGGGAGGSGGGTPNPCTVAFNNPNAASNQTLWNCATSATHLGGCMVNECFTTQCSCTSYVKSTSLCSGGNCIAPMVGTGCSDKSYYSGAPLNCSGDKVTQSACMLRYLILHGHCGP